MKMLEIRFNTWEAFNRAVEEVNQDYGSYLIHGQIYIPAHLTFKGWSEFHRVVKAIRKYPHDDQSNSNDAEYPIYGEIFVELTDPWKMGRD
jgi:hypothetical protein